MRSDGSQQGSIEANHLPASSRATTRGAAGRRASEQPRSIFASADRTIHEQGNWLAEGDAPIADAVRAARGTRSGGPRLGHERRVPGKHEDARRRRLYHA